MARLNSDTLRALVQSLFPDNTSELITPANVRDMLNDIIDSFTPAFGSMARTATIPFNLTTVPTKLTIFDQVVATSPELVVSIANDTITAVNSGLCIFNFTASIAGSNNSDVVVELRRNGLQTFWRALSTTTGAANRVELTLAGYLQNTNPGDEFSIYVNTLTGTDNADFFDVSLIMQTVQTNSL